MPDGRFVSKSISQSEQLASVSIEADYLFARCIPHLDRDGRITGNPVLLKATVCPLRPEITAERIESLIEELARADLVRWYACGVQKVVEFPKFRTHQKGLKYDREAASRLPSFRSGTCENLLRSKSGPDPDEVRLSLSEVKLSEVKGTDGLLTQPETSKTIPFSKMVEQARAANE